MKPRGSCSHSPLVLFLFVGIGTVFIILPAWSQSDLLERVRLKNRESQKILKKAERLKEEGYLNQAVRQYVTLLKEHQNAVVKKEEHLYQGVAPFVRNRIASWPDEEHSVFRTYVKGEAVSLFDKAQRKKDQELLKTVALTYFITQPGRSAARALAKRQFKEGNLSAALFWWNHLLKFHPDASDATDLRKRIAFTLREIDDPSQHRHLRQRLKGNYEQISAEDPPLPRADRNHPNRNKMVYNWPRPGGNSKGTGRIPSHLETYIPGNNVNRSNKIVHLWSYPKSGTSSSGWFIPDTTETDNGQPSNKNSSGPAGIDLNQDTLSNYRYSPIHPIIYEDHLYIHDSSNVYAFELKPLLDSGTNYSRHLKWSSPGDHQFIDGNAVQKLYSRALGKMSLEAYNGQLYFHRLRQNTLHCVQARTGNQMFQTRAPKIDGHRLQFNGTPIVTDEGVFVPLVRKLHDDLDIFLGRFSRTNGDLNWLRFIGSALNTRRYERNQKRNKRSFTHLLSANNQIVLSTNMGLIASVNAVTGEIEWIQNYSNYGRNTSEDSGWTPGKHTMRGLKPPRIINGRLYVLPRDNPCFFGFDFDSGELKLKYRMPDAVRFLDQGRVDIIQKGPSAFFVKKRNMKYSLSILSLQSNSPEEMELDKSFSQLPSVSPGEKRIILGRKQKIWVINRKNAYLKYSRKWPGRSKLSPHEMIATGNRIILVGPGGLTVLTTLDELHHALGNEIGSYFFPFQFIRNR